MTQFSYGPITQIRTDNPDVYAFIVSGHVDDDASEAMAKFMNKIFDEKNSVNMLLDMTGFSGSDWDSMLDGDVIASRFRSLRHVKKYAVIGAPDAAAKMIGFMDKIIPVDARAFSAERVQDAWSFVGAKPVS